MPKKADIKLVGLMTLSVMLAGYAMYQFRDVDAVDQVRSGFGG